MVKVSGLTWRSVGLVKVENALVSGELTEAANGEHEMEVLLFSTNFQREWLFSKCQSFQLTADITCYQLHRTLNCSGSTYFTDAIATYCAVHFLKYDLVFFGIFLKLDTCQNMPKNIFRTPMLPNSHGMMTMYSKPSFAGSHPTPRRPHFWNCCSTLGEIINRDMLN